MIGQGRRLGILFFILILFSQAAQAARTGKVDTSEAVVYDKPNAASPILEKLKKNDPVTASNLPIQGFHRVRTRSGKIGWMRLEDLALNPLPLDARAPASESSDVADPKTRAITADSGPAHRVYLRGNIGLNFFNATGIVGGFDNLKNGTSYGAEFVSMFSKKVGLIVRFDSITKSVLLDDSGTSKTYQLDLYGMPLVGGLTYAWLNAGRFTSRISGLAGTTLKLGLKSTIFGDSSGSTTEVNTSTMNYLGKIDFQLEIAPYLAIYAEGGYRYLKSQVLALSDTSAASSAVLNSTFSINLSGPFIAGGVVFQF